MQSQTPEKKTVQRFDQQIVNTASGFTAYNPSLLIAAGFGDWDGTNILTPSQIEPYLERPAPQYGIAPEWGNFGPHQGHPAQYDYVCQVISDTVNVSPNGGPF